MKLNTILLALLGAVSSDELVLEDTGAELTHPLPPSAIASDDNNLGMCPDGHT